MPSKRLRRILKRLEHPVSSYDTTASREPNCDTSGNADQVDVVLGKKVVDHLMDSSRILLQAIESRKFKRQRCTSIQPQPQQQQTTTTTTPATVRQTDVDHSTNQSIISNDTNNNSNNIINSVHELRKVYLYGLQTVSNLQDLRDAPDAILPGNFCDKE